MQPTFIELPEKHVVGLGTRFISVMSPEQNNFLVIPKLWDQFIKRVDEIRDRKGYHTYGLCEALPKELARTHKDELFYIACAEVTSLDQVPTGMLHRTLPAGRYACFTHKGSLSGLGQTMNFIYRSWLPSSGITLREAPHLELYDKRFDPHSEKSELDILLPTV